MFFYLPFSPQLRWKLIISICIFPATSSIGTLKEKKTNLFFLFDLKSVNLLLSLFLRSVTAEAHCTVSVVMYSDNLGKCFTSLFPKLILPTAEFYYQKFWLGKTDCELSYFYRASFGVTGRSVTTPAIGYLKMRRLCGSIISVVVSLTILAYNCTLWYHKPTAIRIYSTYPWLSLNECENVNFPLILQGQNAEFCIVLCRA